MDDDEGCKALNVEVDDSDFDVGKKLYANSGRRYELITRFEGTFDDYFEARQLSTSDIYRAKRWTPSERKQFLFERGLLKRINCVRHFEYIFDEAGGANYRFLFFFLLYQDPIDEMRRPDKTFSFQTAMKLSQHCLRALQALHKIGVFALGIHCSLFSMGNGRWRHCVMWTELKYLKRAKGKDHVVMRGKKIGVKQNLEYWFMLALHFLSPLDTLPWTHATTPKERQRIKKECIWGSMKDAMFKHVERKEEMLEIMDYIFSKERETFEISWIGNKLTESVEKNGAYIGDPFDWLKMESTSSED